MLNAAARIEAARRCAGAQLGDGFAGTVDHRGGRPPDTGQTPEHRRPVCGRTDHFNTEFVEDVEIAETMFGAFGPR